MNLADDLRLLRQIRTQYKHAVIEWTAHLYTDHPRTMKGISGRALKDLIYSDQSIETIVKIIESFNTKKKKKK